MSKIIIFLIVIIIYTNGNLFSQKGFKAEQMKFDRVAKAYEEKETEIKELFKKTKLPYPPKEVILVGYKDERTLEVWVKDNRQFAKLTEFPFCQFSGTLGPKRKEGDLQIPEGFYYINDFNPNSSYWLSMGTNYPNMAEQAIKATGSDIYIHGDCVTIGCITITDDKIKVLYPLCVEARENGQRNIPVYIFPAKLSNEKFQELKVRFNENKEQFKYPEGLIEFWENMKEGYDIFSKTKKPLKYSAGKKGLYIFSKK